MDITITTSPLTLSRLPLEIFDMILELLDRQTLASCARVNMSWHRICTPRLWFTVTINSGQRLERFFTPEAQLALSKNVGFIRELSLCFESICNVFAPLEGSGSIHTTPTNGLDPHYGTVLDCVDLWKLEICLYEQPTRNVDGQWTETVGREESLGEELQGALLALIRQNPSLKTLEIFDSMTREELLQLLTHDLPNLEALYLSPACSFEQSLAMVLLENLPRGIRNVRICVDQIGDNAGVLNTVADEIRQRLGVLAPRQHHALNSLSIDCSFRTPEEYLMLLPFLETCKRSLVTFSASGIEWARQPQVKEALARLGVFLDAIVANDLPDGPDTGDAGIAEYLDLSTSWKNISLSLCESAGSLTVAAILGRCSHLVQLRLSGCCQIKSKDLCSILGSAPCLKQFMALDTRGYFDAEDPSILAEAFIALDFASLSLELFYCKIEVPRSNRVEGACKEDKLDSEQCRDIQRQVYKKLAEQKMLRHLGLGYCTTIDRNDTLFQEQCLDMTLQSGLDELACLIKMEVLRVGNMNQMIGIPELEWMAKHWIKLTRISGMFSTRVDPVPGAREWIRDHRSDWAPVYDLEWCASQSD
ncbi:hypothetical protein BG003_009550 [Podila horticola]|nr:hypothetical protein BG003_009550 [Podila horticola]